MRIKKLILKVTTKHNNIVTCVEDWMKLRKLNCECFITNVIPIVEIFLIRPIPPINLIQIIEYHALRHEAICSKSKILHRVIPIGVDHCNYEFNIAVLSTKLR